MVYIQSGIRNEPMSSNFPALRKGSAKHEGQSPAEVPRLDRTSLWESAEVFCRNKDTSLQKYIAHFSLYHYLRLSQSKYSREPSATHIRKRTTRYSEHLIVLIPLISRLISDFGSLNNPSKTYGPVGNFTYKTTQLLDKNKKIYHQFSTLPQPFKQKLTKQVEENLTAVSRLPEQVVPFQTTRDKNSHCKRPVQFS